MASSTTPFVTLNTDGNSKNNPSKAGGGGVLRDSQGRWIKHFWIHTGNASNKYGLKKTWELEYKHINLEIDSQILLN